MDYSPVLTRLKQYAKESDLHVTWDDVKEDCTDVLEDLSTYHRRKVHTRFEFWITRRRLKTDTTNGARSDSARKATA